MSLGGPPCHASKTLSGDGRDDDLLFKFMRDCVALAIALAIVTAPSSSAWPDEGGVSLWLPGSFGSLAATPQQPGFSFATFYVHSIASAGGNVAAARQATIGKFNPTVSINLNANINARADLDAFAPSYVFATPVLGGQFAVTLMGVYGRTAGAIDGTLTAMVGPLTATRTGSISDSRTDFGDVFPQASLRWNQGVNNFMIYTFGDIPVGAYDPTRLANIGIGHGATDNGMGYTYFDQKNGNELSVVTGVTYNFKNPTTDYQNGIDWHLDWGASKFLSKQFLVGAVGYTYQQLTADRGAPLILGDNKARVSGIGPQVGYLFPVAGMQGYLNLKGYWEFDASRRASGWDAWLTFALSPPAPGAPPTTHTASR
jgi:hypothetical protein